MAAVAAYDADRAASYLADDAGIQLRTSTVDAESMGRQLRWTRAVEFRLLPGRCELESVSAPAATVACAYDAHGLGSERLGRGPFTDNVLRLTIVDGEIVSGVEELGLRRVRGHHVGAVHRVVVEQPCGRGGLHVRRLAVARCGPR